MQLPSSHLTGNARSAVRFTVVGTTGAIVQTWFFMAALHFMSNPDKGTGLYYVAFGIGYVMEMVPNYFISNWYTFGTRPNWKNAGGFLMARSINLVIQFVLLPVMIALLPSWRDDIISLLVITIGGIINYLVCLLFFKKK
jgi:putative flippase GtrA